MTTCFIIVGINMHELNIFALSISFYCKLAVYDFEPNNHKLTFYGNSKMILKCNMFGLNISIVYIVWVTDTIFVVSFILSTYYIVFKCLPYSFYIMFDSIHFLTISQLKPLRSFIVSIFIWMIRTKQKFYFKMGQLRIKKKRIRF